MLVFAAIMPHPPESIPDVGNSEDKKAIAKTLQAFVRLKFDLEKSDPDTIIIISPHAHLEKYAFTINSANTLWGSFEKFGADRVYGYENNVMFANKLAFAASMGDLPVHLHEYFLDHGSLIPLHHLIENINPKIVHLSFSLMDHESHYRYGELIQEVINKGSGGRVAVIASCDLSHKLTPDAPAGYSVSAAKFDRDVVHYLGSRDVRSILEMREEVCREVAECGIRSILILLGILHGTPWNFQLLSYEGPFGVGYLTARLY